MFLGRQFVYETGVWIYITGGGNDCNDTQKDLVFGMVPLVRMVLFLLSILHKYM